MENIGYVCGSLHDVGGFCMPLSAALILGGLNVCLYAICLIGLCCQFVTVFLFKSSDEDHVEGTINCINCC